MKDQCLLLLRCSFLGGLFGSFGLFGAFGLLGSLGLLFSWFLGSLFGSRLLGLLGGLFGCGFLSGLLGGLFGLWLLHHLLLLLVELEGSGGSSAFGLDKEEKKVVKKPKA